MNALLVMDLYIRKGDRAYDGEGISQMDHGWQCGQLARAAGAAPALQLASWLHDIGHLLAELDGSPTLQGINDRHEDAGAAVLNLIWGPAVSEPVRLHVAAKRYLVATHPGYRNRLSPDSVRSLALQGGPMDIAERVAFQTQTYALDAQQLRAWDDAAKQPAWLPTNKQQALDQLRALMDRVAPV